LVASNGIKIRIEYVEGWEEKLAEALFRLYLRIEKQNEKTA
jgi:hypothetical protein